MLKTDLTIFIRNLSNAAFRAYLTLMCLFGTAAYLSAITHHIVGFSIFAILATIEFLNMIDAIKYGQKFINTLEDIIILKIKEISNENSTKVTDNSLIDK